VNPVDTNDDQLARIESQCDEEFEKQVHDVGLSRLAPQSGERILVIGFRTKHSQAAIAQAVGPNGKALGFDLSELAQLGCPDANLLPYEGHSVDGIFTSYSLERFGAPPLSAVLADCNRVLRQGGRIVVIGVSGTGEEGADRDTISVRQMLAAAGFTIKEAEVRKMWAPIEIVLAVKGSDPATGDRRDSGVGDGGGR
jgi:ubiquinone/menaquinone biosynthesis C-methylase UbiE